MKVISMIKSISFVALMVFVVDINASTFQNSKEEEIEQIISQYQDAHPEVTRAAMQDEIETAYKSNQYEVESMNDLIARLNVQIAATEDQGTLTNLITTVQQVQNIVDIFDTLKMKMNIPDEVILYLMHVNNTDNAEGYGGIGLYASLERRMYLTPTAFGYSPSKQIFTLIHELTHAQQHQRLGLLKFKESHKSDIFDQEHEADVQAIQAISCPVCIQLVEDEWPHDSPHRATEGYLSRAEVQHYKQDKKDSDICKAHASHAKEAKKLRSLMPKKSCWQKMFGCKDNSIERVTLDFKMSGTAEDRLSSVRFK